MPTLNTAISHLLFKGELCISVYKFGHYLKKRKTINMGCHLHRRFSVFLSLASVSALWASHAIFIYGKEDGVISPKSGSHKFRGQDKLHISWVPEVFFLRFPTPETAQEKPLAPRPGIACERRRVSGCRLSPPKATDGNRSALAGLK